PTPSLLPTPAKAGTQRHSASKTRVNALMALDSRFRGNERSRTSHGSRIILALARVRRRPRAQPLHHHRNERENTERHEGAEKLRRERHLHVEFEPAIGAARREAGLVGGLLRGDHAVEAGADEGKREGDRDDAA